MILAAGKGERMLPLTRELPKPLLTVKGKSLIEYHLEALAAAGFREVIINVSYLHNKIIDKLGSGEAYGINIRYSVEDEPLETAGAILHARELLGKEKFLLVNADVWTDFSFSTLRQLALPKQCLGYLVLVANPLHNAGGDFGLSEGGVIEKPIDNQSAISRTFSGVSIIDPQLVFSYTDQHNEASEGDGQTLPLRDVFNWAISNNALCGEFYSGEWSDVGTPERLQQLNAKN